LNVTQCWARIAGLSGAIPAVSSRSASKIHTPTRSIRLCTTFEFICPRAGRKPRRRAAAAKDSPLDRSTTAEVMLDLDKCGETLRGPTGFTAFRNNGENIDASSNSSSDTKNPPTTSSDLSFPICSQDQPPPPVPTAAHSVWWSFLPPQSPQRLRKDSTATSRHHSNSRTWTTCRRTSGPMLSALQEQSMGHS